MKRDWISYRGYHYKYLGINEMGHHRWRFGSMIFNDQTKLKAFIDFEENKQAIIQALKSSVSFK